MSNPLHPAVADLVARIEPPASELAPLLASSALAQSLVLLATHAPPALPALSYEAPASPALRDLRLRAPLAVHDTGALPLVSLLECAQRTASRWGASSAQNTNTASS